MSDSVCTRMIVVLTYLKNGGGVNCQDGQIRRSNKCVAHNLPALVFVLIDRRKEDFTAIVESYITDTV